MGYLFFDIEAANRHNKTAKIYSFGYVLTDRTLNFIKQGEFIINPEADYYFNKKKEGHVRIPCPIEDSIMAKAKTFPKYYDEINELISSNICIGYDTKNDAYMLHESCKRYDLRSLQFEFVDLKEVSDMLLKKKIPGLTKLGEYLGIKNHKPHNGLSDAITTYKICKKLFIESNRDLEDLIKGMEIRKFVAMSYRVFDITGGKKEYVGKTIFKDMKIKDVDIVLERKKKSIEYNKVKNFPLREEFEKWLNLSS